MQLMLQRRPPACCLPVTRWSLCFLCTSQALDGFTDFIHLCCSQLCACIQIKKTNKQQKKQQQQTNPVSLLIFKGCAYNIICMLTSCFEETTSTWVTLRDGRRVVTRGFCSNNKNNKKKQKQINSSVTSDVVQSWKCDRCRSCAFYP